MMLFENIFFLYSDKGNMNILVRRYCNLKHPRKTGRRKAKKYQMKALEVLVVLIKYGNFNF